MESVSPRLAISVVRWAISGENAPSSRPSPSRGPFILYAPSQRPLLLAGQRPRLAEVVEVSVEVGEVVDNHLEVMEQPMCVL